MDFPPRISDKQRETLERAGFDLKQIKSQNDLRDALSAAGKKFTYLSRVAYGKRREQDAQKIFDSLPDLRGASARIKGTKREIIIEEAHQDRGTVTFYFLKMPNRHSEIGITGLQDINPVKHVTG